MKKFALALMASAAMVLGFGMVANAYPPGADAPVVSPASVAPGGTFTVTVDCAPGSTVDFAFEGETKSATCSAAVAGLTGSLIAGTGAALGSASTTFTAPTVAGEYVGTYSGGAVGTFTVTVAAPATPGGDLPATGSDASSTMTIIALGLFAVGAGLFGVSQMRRRTAVA